MSAAIARTAAVGGRFGLGLQGRSVVKEANTTFSRASVCCGSRTTRPWPRGTFRCAATSRPEAETTSKVGSPRRQRTLNLGSYLRWWHRITVCPTTDTSPFAATFRIRVPSAGYGAVASTHRCLCETRRCGGCCTRHPPKHPQVLAFDVEDVNRTRRETRSAPRATVPT